MSDTTQTEKKNLDPFWKCSSCGNTIQAPKAPEQCPSCQEKCAFMDVTCYTPDCGGPGNIDPRLV
ncbi:MAG: rubredoxin-like domain-containing protein [Desulfopila sp.]